MGFFSMSQTFARFNLNYKAKRNAPKTEYLLNKNTPFDVAESFRNLKAALSVSVPKQEGGVVIEMTSAYPEEGKTTVSVNLALMFAQSDAKVLLIDADIRKGRVAKYFKTKPVPGLSDYLSGLVELDDAIHTSRINKNLSFITCGTHSPRPYELLESDEAKNMIKELKKRYDYIFIDTPPMLLISDALALTPVTDGAVLVCRHMSSYISDISRALNTLRFAKANILGVVVNDYNIPQAKKSGNGYTKKYYYYSYEYNNKEDETVDSGAPDQPQIPTDPAAKTQKTQYAPDEQSAKKKQHQ